MRKAGIAVDLIDIDPNWRVYGAGITITGPTLRALQTIGVLDQVIAAGATWNGAKIHDKAGTLLDELRTPPLSADLPAPATGVDQCGRCSTRSSRRKHSELLTKVRLGITVTQLSDRGAQVDVRLSDGTHGTYDLVVAADGIFSTMRGLVFPGAAEPVTTGQVIYRLIAERPPGFDRTHFYMGEDYKVGFNPVSPTHMYMFLLHPAAADPWIEPQDQPQKLYEAMEGFGVDRAADPMRRSGHRMRTASTIVRWKCCCILHPGTADMSC